jgi:tRNA splicing ligase
MMTDWKDAYNITENVRDQYVAQIKAEMDEDPELQWHAIVCGNSLTIALRKSDGTVEVWDTIPQRYFWNGRE